VQISLVICFFAQMNVFMMISEHILEEYDGRLPKSKGPENDVKRYLTTIGMAGSSRTGQLYQVLVAPQRQTK
jgi:hypothetical protein